MLSIRPLGKPSGWTPVAFRGDCVHSGSRDAGFSLVELMVALAIFALAVGVAAPAFRGPNERERLRLLTLTLASDLRLARTNAVLLRRPVSFAVLPALHAYRVDGDGSPIHLPASVGLALSSVRQTSSAADAGGIVFYPDGSSTGGRLTLSDHGASVTLGVEWLTGVVTLEERRP